MTTFNIWISDELLQHIFPAGWPAGGGQAALERIGGVPVGARLLWCGLDRDGIVFKCEVSMVREEDEVQWGVACAPTDEAAGGDTARIRIDGGEWKEFKFQCAL